MPDGRALFVPFAAPGDRVRVRLAEVHKRYARGVIERLLEPGPGRCQPLCPVYGTCGGCSWQHLDHSVQLESKERILRDALERIGRLSLPEPIPITPSPAAYGYRNRARVLVEGGQVGYRRRRSNQLCAATRCPVLQKSVEEGLQELAERARRGSAEPGEWEIAACARGPSRLAAIGRPAAGQPVCVRVCGFSLRVSPGVFVQGNGLLLDALAEAVVEAATRGGQARAGRVLELYAGAGFLTLPLTQRSAAIRAVESNPAAVRDLRANLQSLEGSRIQVIHGRAERVLADLRRSGERPEVVVLDPPRTGLESQTLRNLLKLAPKRVVYLSCDPATLARDLSALCADRYSPHEIQGFDLFPQTSHVEAMAVLELAQ